MGLNNTSYEIIRRPIFTERSTDLQGDENRYVFEVACYANKVQIRRAVEEIYKVHVEDVNTMVRKGKKKRLRYQYGMTAKTKRAVVKIKEGERIDLM